MSRRNQIQDKLNRFKQDEPGHEDVNSHLIVPGLAKKEGERVVARPTLIHEITPDPKQPRRVFPAKFRGQSIESALVGWKLAAEDATGEKLDLKKVLTGEADLPEWDAPSVAAGFAELMQLAADIYRAGLQNPITIYEEVAQKFVLTGERRLIAHHLLYEWVDREAWAKIPARVVDYDVRQQVSENTQRRDLNAVGLARCYALIVMRLYEEDGRTFKPYRVDLRGCDRAFYAQVAEMQVPYGKSGEVMGALNVKSRQSVANYKDVLTLPDDVWTQADEEDWSLRRIMEYLSPSENVQRVGHSPSSQPPTPPGMRTFTRPEREWVDVPPQNPPPKADPSLALPVDREGTGSTPHQSVGEETPPPPPPQSMGRGDETPDVEDDPVEDVPEYVLSDEVPATFMGMMAHLLSLFGREDDAEFSLWLRDLRYDELNQMDGRELAVRLARAKELLNGFMVGEMLDLMDHWFDRIGEEYGDMPHGT